ncbi:MAG: hypothetical protein LBN32_00900 [Helicobacteraceae bacterium]|nr:hypothetical protein [Helicobacteraceae bacterium]
MSASGAQEVTLPTTITVKRANVPLVVNVKETNTTNAGSYSQASKIDREFFSNNPGFLVGLLSSTTDVISGSMWTYDENITVPVTRK